MRLQPRGRSRYNPVSSNDAEEEINNTATATAISNEEASTATTTSSSSRRKRDNNSLHTSNNNNNNNNNNQQISKEDTPLKTENNKNNNNNESDDTNSKGDDDGDNDDSFENDPGERITVVILDSAQKKFPIPANPDWTIGIFKRIGYKIHKVAPVSQRLIFRGKMLDDKKTLRDLGIHTDDLIVHLFPKPRVVVTNRSLSSSADDNHNNGGGDSESGNGGGGGGAHIPQIILDEEEQQRRGQILVLGSAEIAEAQNNVKLLSLLLLVVCAMRLMALFSIAMGVAEEPVYVDDDITPPDSGNSTSPDGNSSSSSSNNLNDGYPDQYQVRPWEVQDYFDLLVSGIGFYVATLGMKATTENTLRLANAYLVGTVIAGITWNVWNTWMYLLFVKEETTPSDDDEIMPLTRDDFVTVAFFTVMLPLGVWWMCCVRAWQFRALIAEAELEATERIQSQLRLTEGADDDLDDDDGDDGDDDDGSNTNNTERELTQLASSTASNISIV